MPLCFVGKVNDPSVRRFFALKRQRQKAVRAKAMNHKKDRHHLLFWRKRWMSPRAKELREDDYLKVMLPYTLHQELHARMRYTIPCPDEEACERAIEAIAAAKKAGTIDLKHDTAVRRLNFLINIWGERAPRTVECLICQRDLLAKFYDYGHL